MIQIHAIIGKEIKECERMRWSIWIHPGTHDNILEKIIYLFPPTKVLKIETRAGYILKKSFGGIP